MRIFKLFVILILCTGGIFGADIGEPVQNFSFSAVPVGSIPLGSSDTAFKFGVGTELSGVYFPKNIDLLGIKAGLGFLSLPLNSPVQDHSVWIVTGFGGPYLRIPFGDRFSIYADGHAGYYYWGAGGWDAGDAAGGAVTAGGSAGALFRIAGPFTLGAGVSYDYYSKLYNGLNIALTVSLDFPGLEKEKSTLELQEIKLLPLFPVLYSYYADNPIGRMRVLNRGTKPANDISLQIFVDRYMDNPMAVGHPFSLAPGEEKTVELYALFNEYPMEITEGTKTSAQITISYPGEKDVFTTDASGILEFYNRNAMMWDDDQKIASFMTAKDPEVMNFAKNVVSWMQSVKNPAIDDNLQKAIAIFEAVKAYGIRYEIDPATPFSEFSEETHAVDYLQFPRQTLKYTNGDCDDLTTLYSSLLEAVGVESAFITVPGHIYAAFALKSSPNEALKTFITPENLIIIEEKVWLPVEITMFQDSFEKAWFTGAKEWREHKGAGQAQLYPVRDAWEIYQAVGFRDGIEEISLPNRSAVTDATAAAIIKHVEREIFPREDSLKKKLRQNPEDIRTRNKLALVYARYGHYDQALIEFMKILEKQEYLPSLTNTGNIYYLKSELIKALEYYNRALAKNDRNRSALVGMARCNYDMENYGLVKQTYTKIQESAPDLAERYAFLDLRGDEAARASAVAELSNSVVWEEDQ